MSTVLEHLARQSGAELPGRPLLPGDVWARVARDVSQGDGQVEILVDEGRAVPSTPFRARIGSVEHVLVNRISQLSVMEPEMDTRPQVIVWFAKERVEDSSGWRVVPHPFGDARAEVRYRGRLIGATREGFPAGSEAFELTDPVIAALPATPCELEIGGRPIRVASIARMPQPPVWTGRQANRSATFAQIQRSWMPDDLVGASSDPAFPHNAGELLFFAPVAPVVAPVAAAEAWSDARSDWQGTLTLRMPATAPDGSVQPLVRLHWSTERPGCHLSLTPLADEQGRSLAECGIGIRQTPALVEIWTALPPRPGTNYTLAWALLRPADPRGQRP